VKNSDKKIKYEKMNFKRGKIGKYYIVCKGKGLNIGVKCKIFRLVVQPHIVTMN
jgi:hypothetical protein